MTTQSMFSLLDLPSTPLLQILKLLSHTTLSTLTASCSFLYMTIHENLSLWQRLSLHHKMVSTATSTQSLINMLKKHGNSIITVHLVDYIDNSWCTWCSHQAQVIGVLAITCPNLRHFQFPYWDTEPNFLSTPRFLSLLNAFPNLFSLKGMIMNYYKSDMVVLRINFSEKCMAQLTTIFSRLHNLEKVSLGSILCTYNNLSYRIQPSFLPALLANNPHLKELELIEKKRSNCNCNCHIILSFDHIALLKKSGVRLVRRNFDRIFHPSIDSNTFITCC